MGLIQSLHPFDPSRRASLTLHDGVTGARLATLVPEGAGGRLSARFLRDGRLAVVEAGHGIRLRVFTPEGTETASVDVASGFATTQVTETAPGILAVVLPYHRPRHEAVTVLVDASSGRVIRREMGLSPAGPSWFATGMTPPPTIPTNLFIDDAGALVRLDVATGARQVVLGGR